MSSPGRGHLGVRSRDEVVRVDFERGWVLCLGLADGLEGSSPSEPLEVLGEVVGRDERQHVSLEAFQVRIVEHLDGGVPRLRGGRLLTVRFIRSAWPFAQG